MFEKGNNIDFDDVYTDNSKDEDIEFYVDLLIDNNYDDELREYVNNVNELEYYFDYSDDDDEYDSDSPENQSCSVFIGNIKCRIIIDNSIKADIDEKFIQTKLFNGYLISNKKNSVKIYEKMTFYGIPYSYAFVKFENKDEAIKVIKNCNFTNLDHVPIHLILLDEETKNSLKNQKNCIIVKNIDPKIIEEQLFELFSNFGEVIYCKLQPENFFQKNDKEKSMLRGYVYFRNQKDAQTAEIELKNFSIFNYPIEILPLFQYKNKQYKKCIIKNLTENYKDDDLHQLCSEFGEPVSCRVILDENEKSKKIGICEMKTNEEAIKVVNGLNRRKLDKSHIYCHILSFDEIIDKISKIKSKKLLSYFDRMKNIQNFLLDFIEEDEIDMVDKKFKEIINLLNEYQFDNDEFRSFLYLILNISNNHYRNHSFFSKIFQILNIYKEKIKLVFSNIDMYYFFISNKQILLFLVQEKILIIDEIIADEIINDRFLSQNYSGYFYFEIKKIKTNIADISDVDLEEFEKKRQIGENTSYICQLIRNDDLDEFIEYINKNSIQLESTIKNSIFETNPLLLKKDPSLIEYSAFFGAIRIFNYLYKNKVELKPSLWCYGIHGKNAEIINFLEEKKVEFHNEKNKSNIYICLKESIKCFQHEIAYYFINKLIEKNQKHLKTHLTEYMLHYHNYNFFSNDFNNFDIFDFACKYDDIVIVKFLLAIQKFYISLKIINC